MASQSELVAATELWRTEVRGVRDGVTAAESAHSEAQALFARSSKQVHLQIAELKHHAKGLSDKWLEVSWRATHGARVGGRVSCKARQGGRSTRCCNCLNIFIWGIGARSVNLMTRDRSMMMHAVPKSYGSC